MQVAELKINFSPFGSTSVTVKGRVQPNAIYSEQDHQVSLHRFTQAAQSKAVSCCATSYDPYEEAIVNLCYDMSLERAEVNYAMRKEFVGGDTRRCLHFVVVTVDKGNGPTAPGPVMTTRH